MRIRAVAVMFLLVLIMSAAGATAQEDYPYDASITAGCAGWRECYRRCRDDYSSNRDTCDWISWTGFYNYCVAESADSFRACTDACYIDCQTT